MVGEMNCLGHGYFCGDGALAADVDAARGVGDLAALEVEVFCFGIDVVNGNVFDAGARQGAEVDYKFTLGVGFEPLVFGIERFAVEDACLREGDAAILHAAEEIAVGYHIGVLAVIQEVFGNAYH